MITTVLDIIHITLSYHINNIMVFIIYEIVSSILHFSNLNLHNQLSHDDSGNEN